MYSFVCECKSSFLSDKCPEVQILGHMGVACLILQDSILLFYIVAVPFALIVLY